MAHLVRIRHDLDDESMVPESAFDESMVPDFGEFEPDLCLESMVLESAFDEPPPQLVHAPDLVPYKRDGYFYRAPDTLDELAEFEGDPPCHDPYAHHQSDEMKRQTFEMICMFFPDLRYSIYVLLVSFDDYMLISSHH